MEVSLVLNQHRRQGNQQFRTLHNYITVHNNNNNVAIHNSELCNILCDNNNWDTIKYQLFIFAVPSPRRLTNSLHKIFPEIGLKLNDRTTRASESDLHNNGKHGRMKTKEKLRKKQLYTWKLDYNTSSCRQQLSSHYCHKSSSYLG